MYETLKTLKLDSSYRPIAILNVFDAFTTLYCERANLVEAYPNIKIRSTYQEFEVPSVISLNKYIKRDKLFLKCNRENIFWRDNNICQYCSKKFPETFLTLDHVSPRSKGGPKTWENIVTSCKSCNQRKGDKLPYEINMLPIRLPQKPAPHIFKIIQQTNIPDQWLKYLSGYTL